MKKPRTIPALILIFPRGEMVVSPELEPESVRELTNAGVQIILTYATVGVK